MKRLMSDSETPYPWKLSSHTAKIKPGYHFYDSPANCCDDDGLNSRFG